MAHHLSLMIFDYQISESSVFMPTSNINVPEEAPINAEDIINGLKLSCTNNYYHPTFELATIPELA
ncbi:10522_t:CDS:1, partial [Ambispora gerdemannii]